MAKMQGLVMFGTLEEVAVFPWTDDKGQTKNLESYKVLVAHADRTVSRESVSLPAGYRKPQLQLDQEYGFPVSSRVSKKGKITYTAHPQMMPFPAPEVGD